MALTDRDAILVYIAHDNPTAAINQDIEFETKAENARKLPTLYKPGRVKGTREIVVRPNCDMVYRVSGAAVALTTTRHAWKGGSPAGFWRALGLTRTASGQDLGISRGLPLMSIAT